MFFLLLVLVSISVIVALRSTTDPNLEETATGKPLIRSNWILRLAMEFYNVYNNSKVSEREKTKKSKGRDY